MKVVITIKVSKAMVAVRRWDEHAVLKEDIVVTRDEQGSITVTGGPLRIPFRDLFLKDPVGDQGDLIFQQSDLEEWAEAIWKHFDVYG